MQRLLTCQQYVHKLALTQVRWNPNLPRYSHRYISPRNENSFHFDLFNVHFIIKFNFTCISFFHTLCCLVHSALPDVERSNGGLRYWHCFYIFFFRVFWSIYVNSGLHLLLRLELFLGEN